MIFRVLAAAACLTALLTACGERTVEPGQKDGSSDAGFTPSDAGASDVFSTADASAEDSGAPDGAPSPDAQPTPDAGDTDAGFAPDAMAGGFTLSGRVTFDWVPALDDFTEGGPKLDYTQKAARPVRRAVVEAREGTTVLATARTDDDGHYSLTVNGAHTVKVRVNAHAMAQGYTPDGIGPEACNGANFDVEVIDNTRGRASYAVESAGSFRADSSSADVRATLERFGNRYTARTAAPFTLLDTVLRELELICTAEPNVDFPKLWVNWSENNSTIDGNVAAGEIGTSYHELIGGQSNLFIVGKDNDDTDEYDDHVVAHETGHYIEAALYRSDSAGGDHVDDDMLDPTVAFGEGWGNAVSGMVWEDPIYVDTSGDQQNGGFAFSVAMAPSGGDRGIYSENSCEYLLWELFDRGDAQPNAGSFAHLHTVLKNDVATTPALTTALTFAAHYNARFGGAAEGLRTIWEQGLDQPYDALCSGACTGAGDTADPWDTQNLLGQRFATGGASPRQYPLTIGMSYDAEFWQLYRPLSVGANAATAHDQTRFGAYDYPDNKWGVIRNYRLTAAQSGMATVSISNLRGRSCNQDVLDLYVYQAGAEVTFDDSTSGCPSVDFPVQQGATYIIQADGLTNEVSGWTTNLQIQKRRPPVKLKLKLPEKIAPGATIWATLTLSPGSSAAEVSFRARGLDGVELLEQRGERLRLRVPSDRAGALAIDVRGKNLRTGRPFGFTKSFRVGAAGTKAVLEAPGIVENAPGGRRVIVQTAR